MRSPKAWTSRRLNRAHKRIRRSGETIPGSTGHVHRVSPLSAVRPAPGRGTEGRTPENRSTTRRMFGDRAAPTRVRPGPYAQGSSGQKIFSRLDNAGVVPPGRGGWQDDGPSRPALASPTSCSGRPRGVLKFPRRSTNPSRPAAANLEQFQPHHVVFTFKATAKLLGDVAVNGFVPGLEVAGSEVFVMPGPYESGSTATRTLKEFGDRLA